MEKTDKKTYERGEVGSAEGIKWKWSNNTSRVARWAEWLSMHESVWDGPTTLEEESRLLTRVAYWPQASSTSYGTWMPYLPTTTEQLRYVNLDWLCSPVRIES